LRNISIELVAFGSKAKERKKEKKKDNFGVVTA
jgi:hypothetical protein